MAAALMALAAIRAPQRSDRHVGDQPGALGPLFSVCCLIIP
jgi:hypothetical protein